jgi:hypothetical protein
MGPIPRVCTDFAEDPSLLIDYENYCQPWLRISQPLTLCPQLKGEALDLDRESHHIFIVKRNEIYDLEEYCSSSLGVIKLICSSCCNWSSVMSRNDHTHLQGQEGITLTLKRMETSRQRNHFHRKPWPEGEKQASKFYGPGLLRGIAVLVRMNTDVPYSFCPIL